MRVLGRVLRHDPASATPELVGVLVGPIGKNGGAFVRVYGDVSDIDASRMAAQALLAKIRAAEAERKTAGTPEEPPK